ncbi:heavy metal-associated isoprenylated plant protein 3 [Ananas comosus]|uniref:Heavy metal-associated isoprenylated plant protein 3 n=1 Tax=Ananas comosus TaxID=4615 RepID=A0A6P5FHH5_ANACO|nr:heavy metal-associated isoprenylated plant protein 3 [Ananas comosus]
MGEKGEKGGEGEKKKGGGGGGGKDGNAPVVLKTELHCEGCANKVKRAIKGIEGVEGVSLDMVNDKVTVRGNADPWEIKERLEVKTGKKADIVSPANPPRKTKKSNNNNNGDHDKKKKDGKVRDGKKDSTDFSKDSDIKKPKELPVSTVVLKIRLHCEGCVDRIKRTISKIKGVEEVKVDAAKDLVTVKGTMDPKSLPSLLKDKLKRGVDLVPPSKDKDKDKDEKKSGGGGGGGGGEKSTAPAPAPVAAAAAAAAAGESSRFEYYAPYGYRMEMAHAPQLFSDENPNACAVM